MGQQLHEYRVLLLRRLEQQPTEFAALADALPEAEWHARRVANGATLHQIAAHVRDAEALAFWPRIRRILSEESPHLEAFPEYRWATDKTYHPEEPLQHIIAAFARTRAEALATLKNLNTEDWSRTGFHPPSGLRTVQWWVERMLNHARDHLEAIRQAGSLG
ncbi:MAG: DinB family protein [Anaerolineales bacterium]|nr:DinB family protein [Anaerolineales bacterium]